jgi:uncharacterized protein (DUF433 family)
MPTVLNESAPTPVWEGIYEAAEAAKYLKATSHAHVVYPLSSAKLIRWIRNGLGDPALAHVPGRELVIAFPDLISMRVVAALRNSGVSLQAIGTAERWLREVTGQRHPLATEIIWAGQGQVFAEWGDQLVSGSARGQMALDMLREYLIPIHGLTFDKESGSAISWEPSNGIVLQPQVQFGAPCIKGTRIPTRSLAGMVEAGDSVESVAKAYNLTSEMVQAACDWEHHLQSA